MSEELARLSFSKPVSSILRPELRREFFEKAWGSYLNREGSMASWSDLASESVVSQARN